LDGERIGVVSTFWLELENSGGCILLLVGAKEFRELELPSGWIPRTRGWSLLPVVAGESEFGNSNECILLIYKKSIMWFYFIWVST
jgi:hypothetical protein